MKVLDVFSIKCDIMAVLCDNWRDNKTKFIAIKKGLYIKRGLNKMSLLMSILRVLKIRPVSVVQQEEQESGCPQDTGSSY